MRGFTAIFFMLFCGLVGSAPASMVEAPTRADEVQLPAAAQQALDATVTKFLESRRGTWRDMNVPDVDGRALYNLIVERGLTRGLEIGTSTGHSGIWIAWAFSRTGGRLITVEIDRGRHAEAVRNVEAAGLAAYIDARLADAHELVPALDGPFDFVFIDADKDWYVNYAKAVLPKLTPNGVLTAHNVSGDTGRGRRGGQGADYYAFVTARPDLQTTIVNGQLAITVRRAPSAAGSSARVNAYGASVAACVREAPRVNRQDRAHDGGCGTRLGISEHLQGLRSWRR
jgi:caffeoyl-CoA O-methyltransferase